MYFFNSVIFYNLFYSIIVYLNWFEHLRAIKYYKKHSNSKILKYQNQTKVNLF